MMMAAFCTVLTVVGAAICFVGVAILMFAPRPA